MYSLGKAWDSMPLLYHYLHLLIVVHSIMIQLVGRVSPPMVFRHEFCHQGMRATNIAMGGEQLRVGPCGWYFTSRHIRLSPDDEYTGSAAILLQGTVPNIVAGHSHQRMRKLVTGRRVLSVVGRSVLPTGSAAHTCNIGCERDAPRPLEPVTHGCPDS